MNKSELLGLQQAAKLAIQPNMLGFCGENDDQTILRRYLTQPDFDPLIVRQTLNSRSFPHLNAFLETIAEISGQDPFSDEVVKSYWLGNNLTETTVTKGKSLLLHQYAKRFPKEFVAALEKKIPEHIPLTHLTQVAFIAPADDEEFGRIRIINQCMIAGGMIIEINLANKLAVVNRDILEQNQEMGYHLTCKNLKVKIDPGLTPNLVIGDRVAVHLGYIADTLTIPEMSDLNDWTNRIIPLL